MWPHAKAGNLEARFYLSIATLPPPHMALTFPPGSDDSMMSRYRNGATLLTYALDYEDKEGRTPYMQPQHMVDIYRLAGLLEKKPIIS